jgi:hypothetical protein
VELADTTLESVVETFGDVRAERVGDGGHAAILRTRPWVAGGSSRRETRERSRIRRRCDLG